VDEAVDCFRGKAESLDAAQHGSHPIEVYLQLLERVGRPQQAVQALLEFARRNDTPQQQLMPLLLDLSAKAGDFQPLLEYCRERGDLLGFATGLVSATASS
jgi:hypothetical protein